MLDILAGLKQLTNLSRKVKNTIHLAGRYADMAVHKTGDLNVSLVIRFSTKPLGSTLVTGFLDEDASPDHPDDTGGGVVTVDNKLDEDASPDHPDDTGGGAAATGDTTLDEDASPDHPDDTGGGGN